MNGAPHGRASATNPPLRRGRRLPGWYASSSSMRVGRSCYPIPPILSCCSEPAFRRNDLASARSEEHTSELQSLMRISYAVFCLKKKIKHNNNQYLINTLSLHTLSTY